jgi:hypothetical protein
MIEKEKRTGIAGLCAPTNNPPTVAMARQSRICSLTQMGTGCLGQESRQIACLVDRRTDERGNFLGETPHPVIGALQHDPRVAALLRTYEMRAGISDRGVQCLVYRKGPPRSGLTNGWITSADAAMAAWVGTWGRVIADHNAEVYRFERLNIAPYSPGQIQPIDDLIDELLTDLVVERLDDPLVLRLLGLEQSSTVTPVETDDIIDLEDDDAIYD